MKYLSYELEERISNGIEHGRTTNVVREYISDYFSAFHVDRNIFLKQGDDEKNTEFAYPEELVDLILDWINQRKNANNLKMDRINDVEVEFLARHGRKLSEIINALDIDADVKKKQKQAVRRRTLYLLNEAKINLADYLTYMQNVCGLEHHMNFGKEFTYIDDFYKIKKENFYDRNDPISYTSEIKERVSFISADDYTYFLSCMQNDIQDVFDYYKKVYHNMNHLRMCEMEEHANTIKEEVMQMWEKIARNEIEENGAILADTTTKFLGRAYVSQQDIATFLGEKYKLLSNCCSSSEIPHEKVIADMFGEMKLLMEHPEKISGTTINKLKDKTQQVKETYPQFCPSEINVLNGQLEFCSKKFGDLFTRSISARRVAHEGIAKRNNYYLDEKVSSLFLTTEELIDMSVTMADIEDFEMRALGNISTDYLRDKYLIGKLTERDAEAKVGKVTENND